MHPSRVREEADAVQWAAHHVPDNQELAAEIALLVCEQLGVDLQLLRPSTRFIEDLAADELEPVELAMALEQDYKISISDDEGIKMETLADMINLVATKTGRTRASRIPLASSRPPDA